MDFSGRFSFDGHIHGSCFDITVTESIDLPEFLMLSLWLEDMLEIPQ